MSEKIIFKQQGYKLYESVKSPKSSIAQFCFIFILKLNHEVITRDSLAKFTNQKGK